MTAEADDLALLVASVRQSARYRQVSPDLVAAIGRRELAARRGLKDAVKATKGRLHQVSGAFFDGEPRYDRWLDALETAVTVGEEAFRAACLVLMRHHASTRERLPILDRFYAQTLSALPPIRSVIDLGCGLNPLTLSWMGLASDVTYRGYDIDAGLIDFLNRFFALVGVDGAATLCDLVTSPPREEADLALALKLLPTLDHLERGAAVALPRSLRARHLLVSFPARSLGGRHGGLAQQHEARFTTQAQDAGWRTQRFAFPGELAFPVDLQ